MLKADNLLTATIVCAGIRGVGGFVLGFHNDFRDNGLCRRTFPHRFRDGIYGGTVKGIDRAIVGALTPITFPVTVPIMLYVLTEERMQWAERKCR